MGQTLACVWWATTVMIRVWVHVFFYFFYFFFIFFWDTTISEKVSFG
jgi:hypothetical protein